MFAIVFASLFLAVICILAVRRTVPPGIAAAYIAASVVAFVAYALDKSAAQRGAWRTSERTLHVMSVIGGWPGALVAQRVFRHKSRKLSFRLAFWTTVALNCAALIWFLWTAQR